MKTIQIGGGRLAGSRLAYGCWRLTSWGTAASTPDEDAHGRAAVIAAYEAGYTLFDNADIYCRGEAERIFGEAVRAVSGMRQNIVVATKCGIRFAGDPAPGAPHRYDFSAAHIVKSCEDSLRRMGIETIDLYQLHRPDWLMAPEEIAGAFESLRLAGKVRCFGVSNFRPAQVAALQAALPEPLVVHQVEISLARLDCFTDGTLDQCQQQKMTPLAWSPLARGLLGDSPAVTAKNSAPASGAERIIPVLDEIARERGVSRTVVALAWLLKHPTGIVPIVGSTRPERIREAVAADGLDLSREEWYRLLLAARGEPLP